MASCWFLSLQRTLLSHSNHTLLVCRYVVYLLIQAYTQKQEHRQAEQMGKVGLLTIQSIKSYRDAHQFEYAFAIVQAMAQLHEQLGQFKKAGGLYQVLENLIDQNRKNPALAQDFERYQASYGTILCKVADAKSREGELQQSELYYIRCYDDLRSKLKSEAAPSYEKHLAL